MQKGFKNDFEVTREIECEILGRWATKFATQGKRFLVVIDQNFDLRQVHSSVSGMVNKQSEHIVQTFYLVTPKEMMEFMLSVYVDVDVERTN